MSFWVFDPTLLLRTRELNSNAFAGRGDSVTISLTDPLKARGPLKQ